MICTKYGTTPVNIYDSGLVINRKSKEKLKKKEKKKGKNLSNKK